MGKNSITLQMEGKDKGEIYLSDFIDGLRALRNALKYTELSITGAKEPSLYYKIVKLSYSSPATVVIEPTSIDPEVDRSSIVEKTFSQGIQDIQESKPPKIFDTGTLASYKTLSNLLCRNIVEMRIITAGFNLPITRELSVNIEKLFGSDEMALGSLDGQLEILNIHEKPFHFNIYPAVGPQKVLCNFPEELLPKAIESVGQYINVSGEIFYHENAPYPHRINVSNIEIYPPEKELPTLWDLRGIAPDITGKLTTQDFLRKMRNA